MGGEPVVVSVVVLDALGGRTREHSSLSELTTYMFLTVILSILDYSMFTVGIYK
jgi:hypothetical protein